MFSHANVRRVSMRCHVSELTCDELHCPKYDSCFTRRQTCDGIAQCVDGYDEYNCGQSSASNSSNDVLEPEIDHVTLIITENERRTVLIELRYFCSVFNKTCIYSAIFFQ